MNGQDFASLLERAIERSGRGQENEADRGCASLILRRGRFFSYAGQQLKT